MRVTFSLAAANWGLKCAPSMREADLRRDRLPCFGFPAVAVSCARSAELDGRIMLILPYRCRLVKRWIGSLCTDTTGPVACLDRLLLGDCLDTPSVAQSSAIPVEVVALSGVGSYVDSLS